MLLAVPMPPFPSLIHVAHGGVRGGSDGTPWGFVVFVALLVGFALGQWFQEWMSSRVSKEEPPRPPGGSKVPDGPAPQVPDSPPSWTDEIESWLRRQVHETIGR